jgi:tetratricopeptide (TPR) repeat protein
LEKENRKGMRKIFLIFTFLFILAITVQAQNERKFVRQGNKYFLEAMKDTAHIDTVQFNKAEIEYRKAIEKKPTENKWNFNLADALYKQKKFEESAEKFKEIVDKTFDKDEKSRALHNLGNSMLMGNKIDESIAAYKEALRNNPGDMETKYNLQYAMNLKKKQQQQKNQDKNKDQDKKKDQNKKDQNKDQKDQNKDQDKKDKDQQNKNQNQNQQNQPQESKISKQNAEQMLQALENNEKKIQDKVKKMQAMKAQSKRVDKDW